MNLATLRTYLLDKKGSSEERPFGPETLVFKVMGKMFALTGDDPQPESVNLKCDPDRALALRAQYTAVQPGYHMNKKHWNTVLLDDSLPEDELYELIDHSYELVVKGLKKSERDRLQNL